jgi:hypothetical protein
VKHLNSQWDALEKILLCGSPATPTSPAGQFSSHTHNAPPTEGIIISYFRNFKKTRPYFRNRVLTVEYVMCVGGVDWLKEWLGSMEGKLEPLHFRTEWTPDKLLARINHHKVNSSVRHQIHLENAY